MIHFHPCLGRLARLAIFLVAIAVWVEPVRAGGQIFVTNYAAGTIGEYDATTGATVNATLVSGLTHPRGIAVSGGNLYVESNDGATIGEYSAATGAPLNAALVTALNGAGRIVVAGGNLYAVTNGGFRVGEYNATTGATVNATFISPFDPMGGIAVSGSNLFITINTQVSEYNATTGATMNATLVTGPNLIYDVAASQSDLFLMYTNTQTIGKYTASGVAENAALVSGVLSEDIHEFGGNLYVLNNDGNPSLTAIGEYNAATGATVNAALLTIPLAGGSGFTVVPEPSSLVLAAVGFASLAAWRRKR